MSMTNSDSGWNRIGEITERYTAAADVSGLSGTPGLS